jgi:hypothetical protein
MEFFNSPEYKRVVDLFKSGAIKRYFDRLEFGIVPSFISLDWFLSYRFLLVCDLEELFHETRTKGVDRRITSAFEQYMTRCRKNLIKKHHQRVKVLTEVFQCYSSKRYSAVIALAYSTAEGLVYETFGQNFWGGYDKKLDRTLFEKLRDEQQIDGMLRMHYKRLSYRGVINENSERIASQIHTSNNRHLVLHGRSYKYGSKKNAIKAILLLDFVSELVYLKTKGSS